MRGVIAFTFMLVGYYLKDYYKNDVNKQWYVIVLSVVLTYIIAMLNGQIDFGAVAWEINFVFDWWSDWSLLGHWFIEEYKI